MKMDVDMDKNGDAAAAAEAGEAGGVWGPRLVDEETQDPEELRVFYSAVESFS